MKLGIMQPYFMPYIGYWQRIGAVDKHVIYDDVNYIKNGWMNHNRIVLNGEVHCLSAPLIGASPNKLVNEVNVNNNPILQGKMLKTLEVAYHKSPYFDEAMSCLEPIIRSEETNFARYLEYQINEICRFLHISTKLIMSSSIEKDNSQKGQRKVIAICRLIGATEYYNALSGNELYCKDDFLCNGVKLVFIRNKGTIRYTQMSREFLSSLSIIDVMMNCSETERSALLADYELS